MRLPFTPLLALGLCACGVHRVRVPVTGGRDATVGCYQLSFGPWVPAFPPSANLGSLRPPSPLQLRASGDVTPRCPFLGPGFASLPGSWKLGGTDSLIVTWNAGEMGVQMRLTPMDDSLTGHATLVFWRMGAPDPAPSATVSMVPVPCV